jgi:hypothetical protein
MWFSYGDPDVLRTIFHSANVDAFNRAVPGAGGGQDAGGSGRVDGSGQAILHLQGRAAAVLKDTAVVPLVDTLVYNAKRAEVSGEVLDALASYVWLYDVQIKK